MEVEAEKGNMASEDEMMLLERVFLRIGSTETDAQLETELKRFLCPVLLKLASQTEGVRKKVMELLVHVNKRLKSRNQVQLPLDDLLLQYADPTSSSFVTNFTVLYIKMGYPRLPPDQQSLLLPRLLHCISDRPEPQQNSLLQLFVIGLQHFKISEDTSAKKKLLNLEEKTNLRKLLLQFLLDVVILPYSHAAYQIQGQHRTAAPPAAPPAAAQGATSQTTDSSFNGPPPGLSESAFKRVTGENPPTPEQLEKLKLAVVELCGASIFTEQEIVCHLIVGTADTRHGVASAADRELKRIIGNQDWNNTTVVAKMFSIFQGTVIMKGQKSTLKSDQKRTPSGIPLRLKLFPYFLKSREATNQFPACVQVVFDCLYGTTTNMKLKTMAVQFVHHLCLHCIDSRFTPIGTVLLSGMVKLFSPGTRTEDAKLRSLAYVACGKIGKRAPQLVAKDTTLLQTFFEAICKEETSENRLAVQEALSLMASAFSTIDPANAKMVEALIMHNVDKAEPQARLMAVQYAKTVFPPDHVPSRYVLLIASGDSKEDVYGEASRALKAPLKPDDEKKPVGEKEVDPLDKKLMPPFVDMMIYVDEKAKERAKSAKKFVMGNTTLAFNPACYVEVLLYLRMCLAYNSRVLPNLDSIADMKEQTPHIGVFVNKMLGEQSVDEKGPISLYINIIKVLLSALGGPPAMYCLLEVVAVARQKLAPFFVKHLDWIKGFMFNRKEEMRLPAAELYALVIVSIDSGTRHTDAIKELTANIKSQSSEGQEGSVLCLGYLIGYLLASKRSKATDLHVEDMEVDQGADDKKLSDSMNKAVIQIGGLLENKQDQLVMCACTALGEIGRNGSLPLTQSTKGKMKISKESVVESLIKKVQAEKNNSKVRDKAALTLGLLCVGEKNFAFRGRVIEGLTQAAAARQMELHFTIGEGLVWAAQGPHSPAARDVWLISEKDYKPPSDAGSDDVEMLLKLLMEKHIVSRNPHVRQAACIWLVGLVSKCGNHPAVQSKLQNVQSALLNMLSENDDMTQDIASKGLGLVYERCDQAQKDSLVSVLVDTLTTGKRRKIEVTEDTKMFEEGAIGKTPDGQGLSTYKELCSIANDLNQPDLIYKFLHLANHNATWNSRRGAAFGFGTIAAQAGEQLAPHLHKIVPKLFRYQFDPNPRIQQAMSSIWSALVTETKATVDKYIKEIAEDLIPNLTNNQWRVRESSCAAVQDLLRGRPLDDIIHLMPELWTSLFRVRDDIKESVRNAADLALKSISRASIKICDPEYGKAGREAISAILPVLVQTGLCNTMTEIRALSLNTLVKISRAAGPLLKPHIPLMVVALLESLSELEPQYLNYLSLHAASSQVAQEKLDSARIAASKSSPMMETINLCLQYVDTDVLAALVPRLNDLIRSGIGVGTKAGCANVYISLIFNCPTDLAPYAGKILAAMLVGLQDRNTSIKKSFASAIGYMVKIAKDSSVEKLINRLNTWYWEKDDESVRNACGVALHAINNKAPDILKRHATTALPLAFYAMHEKEKDEKSSSTGADEGDSVWEEVWLDATPGTEAGLRLYIQEVVQMSQKGLESQSWLRKAQGARTLQTTASKLGSNLGPPHLGLVVNALLTGLSGRTWTGKEALLVALSEVCVSCREAMSVSRESQPDMKTVTDALLRECRKQDVSYRTVAIRSTAAVLEAHDIDRFTELANILIPLIKEEAEEEEDKEEKRGEKWEKLRCCSYDSLGQCWPDNSATQDQHQDSLLSLVTDSLSQNTWRIEAAGYKALHKILKRLCVLKDAASVAVNETWLTAAFLRLVPLLCQSLGNVKYGSVRTEAFGLTELLINKLQDVDRLNLLTCDHWCQLATAVTAVCDEKHPELLDRSKTMCKKLEPVTSR